MSRQRFAPFGEGRKGDYVLRRGKRREYLGSAIGRQLTFLAGSIRGTQVAMA
jgi:hypothetical protein